jgi:hypothetical protein
MMGVVLLITCGLGWGGGFVDCEVWGYSKLKTTLSVDIVRVEFSLNGLPDNAVHIYGFLGEYGGTVELNVMSLANIMLSYAGLIQMFHSDVPFMLL